MERSIASKCTELQVRRIVQEELTKGAVKRQEHAQRTDTQDNIPQEKIDVIAEINERKRRKNNIVVFGGKEQNTDERSARKEVDEGEILSMLETCKLKYEDRVQKGNPTWKV